MINKRQMIIDMLLNIIAASLPIVVIQLIVYPVMAKKISTDAYGVMISVYSIWMMIAGSLSSVLATVRIIHNNEYEREKIVGDYNVVFLRWIFLNSIITLCSIIIYRNILSVLDVLLIIIIAFLVLAKGYLEISFKISLNYRAVVINNLIQCIALIIGLGLFIFTNCWELTFLCGYLASFIYCAFRTNYLFEDRVKTKLYKQIVHECRHLTAATIIANLTNYADKIVLYPLIGGYYLSIYYTATILGKIIGMLAGPINSVVLAYISKYESNSEKNFRKVTIIGVAICICAYFITVIASKPVIGFLYSQWVDEVIKFIPITTIGVLLSTLASILQPFVLKYREVKWQNLISVVNSIIYFGSSFVLLKLFGLMGFCIGVLIGMLSKVVCIIGVFYFTQPVLIDNGERSLKEGIDK